MIYVKLIGRLGNQLFYYAIARVLQEENPNFGDIILIPNRTNYNNFGGIQLLQFNTKIGEISKKNKMSILQLGIDFAFKSSRKLLSLFGEQVYQNFTYKMQPLLNRCGLYCMTGSMYVPIAVNDSVKDIWITGVWENPQYFSKIKGSLLKELKPKEELLDTNRELYSLITESKSVCISIRKGDFLKVGNEKFNVCSDMFYYNALKIMKQRIGDFKLFVFSDDIKWVQENMKFSYQTYYENNDGNDPVWEKLRIMSNCKHFIIANSTFSWWAQYLSDNENKVVIAPRPWRKNEYCDCFYDENFILLNPETGAEDTTYS